MKPVSLGYFLRNYCSYYSSEVTTCGLPWLIFKGICNIGFFIVTVLLFLIPMITAPAYYIMQLVYGFVADDVMLCISGVGIAMWASFALLAIWFGVKILKDKWNTYQYWKQPTPIEELNTFGKYIKGLREKICITIELDQK